MSNSLIRISVFFVGLMSAIFASLITLNNQNQLSVEYNRLSLGGIYLPLSSQYLRLRYPYAGNEGRDYIINPAHEHVLPRYFINSEFYPIINQVDSFLYRSNFYRHSNIASLGMQQSFTLYRNSGSAPIRILSSGITYYERTNDIDGNFITDINIPFIINNGVIKGKYYDHQILNVRAKVISRPTHNNSRFELDIIDIQTDYNKESLNGLLEHVKAGYVKITNNMGRNDYAVRINNASVYDFFVDSDKFINDIITSMFQKSYRTILASKFVNLERGVHDDLADSVILNHGSTVNSNWLADIFTFKTVNEAPKIVFNRDNTVENDGYLNANYVFEQEMDLGIAYFFYGVGIFSLILFLINDIIIRRKYKN